MPRRANSKTKHTYRLKHLNRRGLSRVSLYLVLLVWIGALGVLVANRQNIMDWYRLRNYTAPPVVAQLANEDTMTAYARKVFYVNQPAIDVKETFFKACPSGSTQEQTIVLGCYHGGQSGIFLLSVSDPRLNGVQQVTAAHELLHAAYDRLSSSQRANVDNMLMSYYHNDLHDKRVMATIAAYKKTEPNDLVNEMHSVFGTEIASLPAPLESYYARYFRDRHAITTFAANYQSEFTTRQNTVAADDAQLASLKGQIDANETDLRTKLANITAQQAAMVSLRRNNVPAYNAAVPGFNHMVDDYNTQVQTVQALVAQYNQLVNSRNAVALEEDQLVNDLSTNDVSPIKN